MATKRKTKICPRCTVCRHPSLHAIELAHVAGCSLEAIATKFGTPEHPISRASVHRHCRDHLDETSRASYLADIPLADLAKRAAEEGLSLLDYFALVRSTVVSQMLLAASVNDGNRTAILAGRAIEVLNSIGKVTGELSNMAQTLTITNNNTAIVNMNAPIFVLLQTMLIEKLEPWPEAMSAVIAGLDELEAGGDNAIAA